MAGGKKAGVTLSAGKPAARFEGGRMRERKLYFFSRKKIRERGMRCMFIIIFGGGGMCAERGASVCT
jgi:hypothetical protein